MERIYLILDKTGTPVAQAVMESPPDREMLQLRLFQEPDIDMTNWEIQLVGLDNSSPGKRGVVTIQRGERLAVRATAELGAEARENLRIKTNFQSVMYPVTGRWKGQREIRGYDLSCGGLAFYTANQELKVGEVVQVVLPVTDEPLLLRLRVLRELQSDADQPLYASRFIDICLDEEVAIRKAVFNIQVSGPRQKD